MTSFDPLLTSNNSSCLRSNNHFKADLTVNLANCVKDSYTVKELKVSAPKLYSRFSKEKDFSKISEFFFNLRAQKSAFKLLAENEAAKLRANDTVGAESDSKQGEIFICNDS